MIEMASFEVDGGYGEDGNQTRGFLILHGDFVDEFTEYLADDSAGSVALRLDRDMAEALVGQIKAFL
jgi:hypothetical protein